MNWKQKILLLTLGLVACGVAFPEQTNTTSKSDYSFFKIIPDRNIFNSNRYPRRSGTRRSDNTRAIDAFQLVGTMSYEKGIFAFFDGPNPDYQKVLELNGSIVGFTLTAIGPNSVVLAVSNKSVELKVGDQMRHDAEGGWQLIQDAEESSVAPSVEKPDALSEPPPSSDGDIDQSDVIKKMMQRREEELQ